MNFLPRKSSQPPFAPLRAVLTLMMVLVSLLLIGPQLAQAAPAVCPTCPPTQDEDAWKTEKWLKRAPTGARASFEMPIRPRYVERSFSPFLDKPPVKVRLHMATVAEGKVTFMFGYHDLHEIPREGKMTNAALDGAVRGSVVNVMGILVDTKKLGMTSNPQTIRREGSPGRQYVCQFVQNERIFIVTAQIILVGKRQYQLNCIMEKEIYEADVAVKFLNSFKLIPAESDAPPRPRVLK